MSLQKLKSSDEFKNSVIFKTEKSLLHECTDTEKESETKVGGFHCETSSIASLYS